MKNIFLLFVVFILAASCKKSTPSAAQPQTQSTSNNTPTTTNTVSPASSTYSISFTDGIAKTYTLISTIQLLMSSYPSNANMEFGTGIQTPGNSSYVYGHIYLVFPLDSSNLGKVLLNTSYPVNYRQSYLAQSVSDNYIGNLYFLMSGSTGTDSTVSSAFTTAYYHKITSIQYIGHKYDTYNMIESPQYVIKGVFTAEVKNDVTQQTRVFSNGQYSLVLGFRPQ